MRINFCALHLGLIVLINKMYYELDCICAFSLKRRFFFDFFWGGGHAKQINTEFRPHKGAFMFIHYP